MPLVDLRDSDFYRGTMRSVTLLVFELRKAEVETEAAAFLRALQIYVGWVHLHAVHLFVLRRAVRICDCRSEEGPVQFFDFSNENHLQVFEGLKRGSLPLEFVQVVLNGRDLEGLFVEGVLFQNYFQGLFLARFVRLILLEMV